LANSGISGAKYLIPWVKAGIVLLNISCAAVLMLQLLRLLIMAGQAWLRPVEAKDSTYCVFHKAK
jgi:hypothetical protein